MVFINLNTLSLPPNSSGTKKGERFVRLLSLSALSF
jgi:hypothetical protein